jgi:hypothetical protein
MIGDDADQTPTAIQFESKERSVSSGNGWHRILDHEQIQNDDRTHQPDPEVDRLLRGR